jgi:L-alanine-DL-glutamate epimerase-like enolase superfamily enzyme
LANGALEIPDVPGLGLEWNEEAVRSLQSQN